MTYVITSLCVGFGDCVAACPVDCIVNGAASADGSAWPQYYIDPAACIDCGACVSVCPFAAIYAADEVPHDYVAGGGEYLNMPAGAALAGELYRTEDGAGNPVLLPHTRRLAPGEVVDFTTDIGRNAAFFSEGPGYEALDS